MYEQLALFNALLRYPVSRDVLAAIAARQAQITATTSVQGYVPVTANWDTIRLLVTNGLDPDSSLMQLEKKAFSKWVGSQGCAPDYSRIVDRLTEYYPTQVDSATPRLSPETARILRHFYMPLRGLEVLTPWKRVLRETARPTGTSTGYDGFTSDTDMRPILVRHFLPAARAILTGEETPHPSIAWYRSQRNAYRNIFGAALSTLMMEKHVWGNLVNGWIPRLPTSSYKSNLEIQADFLRSPKCYTSRRYLPARVFSFEGDFEHMDTGVDYSTTKFIIGWFAENLEWEPGERARLLRAAHLLFVTPLITYDGDVRLDPHSLFSGQYPTNGLEHHIGVFIFYESLVRAAHDIGVDPSLLYLHTRFKQQGDDSGAIIPYYEGLPEALTVRYVEVAGEFHQRANLDKQRVSFESLLFCKNEFAFQMPTVRGWKFTVNADQVLTPIPRYPLSLAWNATLNPETIPPFGEGEAKYDLQIAAICSIWDNAFGHPNWAANLNYLWSLFNEKQRSFIKSRLPSINYRAIKCWERRVIGEGWNPPNAGSTVGWLSRH